MDDTDTCWCPTCDRQILPKRLQVPVQPSQQQQPPAPPPSSPVRRAQRQRGGLVQGTGRVKPNGAIKQPPVKYRTVIDQGPTPLYCSDKCKIQDATTRILPHNFNPDRHSPASSITFSTTTTPSTSTVSTSFESVSSIASAPPTTKVSKSLAIIAEHYHFDAIPPPPPADDIEPPLRVSSAGDFSDGIIMGGRRMKEELCPPPQRRDVFGRIISEPHKPSAMWTDGSHAWRAVTYGLSAPNSTTPVQHKSFATRGSRGVQSNLSHPRQQAADPLSTSDVPANELLQNFHQSFRRMSRVSTPTSSNTPNSLSSSYPPSRRERPLLQPGTEGKLLVPSVMLRANSSVSSSASLASQYSAPPCNPGIRSPLSQLNDITEEQRSESARLLPQKRPTVETRSWSYDNIKTYPIMAFPVKTRIEKRREMRIVDGEEVEVEYEVEVEEPLKRLFLFGSSMPSA